MKKYLITLTISISLFLIAGTVYAFPYTIPEYDMLSGTVTECVGCGYAPPLEGVIVTMSGASSQILETDYNGVYFSGIQWGGCYNVTFEKPGYTTVTKYKCVSEIDTLDVCLP